MKTNNCLVENKNYDLIEEGKKSGTIEPSEMFNCDYVLSRGNISDSLLAFQASFSN